MLKYQIDPLKIIGEYNPRLMERAVISSTTHPTYKPKSENEANSKSKVALG